MVTILESTNSFNSPSQNYDTIITGDLSDSKLVFQSTLLATQEDLKFKVELYFDDVLIYDTFLPVLYTSGTSIAISNIDLSAHINDYMSTQIGLTTSDDIEDKYNAFRKINNEGLVRIYEYNGDTEITSYGFTIFIYKTIEKDNLQQDYYDDGVYQYTFNDLFLQRYYSRTYNPNTNINDVSLNYDYYNIVYGSSNLLFNFLDKKGPDQLIFRADGDNGDYIQIKTISSATENYILEIGEDFSSIKMFPNDNLNITMFKATPGILYSGFDNVNSAIDLINLDIFKIWLGDINNNTYQYYFNFNTNCEKYPHQLRWLNMLGGYDTFNFDLIHQETIQIKDKGFYQNNFGLTDSIVTNDFKSSYTSYDREYNKKYTFKTDWLTSDQIYLLEDLFKSTEVYFLFGDHTYGLDKEWLSMKNLTKSKTLYHKDIKGLKKYEITIEESIKKEII